jgi:cold shock CspA family protein
MNALELLRGTIISLQLARGYGFIHVVGRHENLYFHKLDLVGLPFDQQLMERRVEFLLIDTSKGPRAKDVQAARD